jgi:hypothetical protein
MSNQNDDQTATTPAQTPDPAASPPAGGTTPSPAQNSDDSGSQVQAIPRSRFNEVVAERNELRTWKAEQEAAAAAAETAQLQEQGKLQELADKLKAKLEEAQPKLKTAEKYEAVLTQYLEKERDGLPDHILPILDKLPVDEQLAYIAEHREVLRPAKAPPPNTNGADGGTGGRVVETPQQRREKKQQKISYRL